MRALFPRNYGRRAGLVYWCTAAGNHCEEPSRLNFTPEFILSDRLCEFFKILTILGSNIDGFIYNSHPA